ncbi:MAG: PaaI family thioesterase [Bacteroidota bacterium]
MAKIRNPYTHVKDYNCFGCAPGNENGLRMQFETDGEVVTSVWEPKSFMQGYNNVLHGGIQATLMDEIGAWLVNIRLNTSGVTSKMETRYIKPVYVDGGPVFLCATLKEVRHKMAFIHVTLKNGEGILCAESHMLYYVMNKEEATEKYDYPGIDAFLP